MDGLLRFRGEWVRNRAGEIRQLASLSFRSCSEDTASITAMNEFYRCRVFDGFIADDADEKNLEIGMTHGRRGFESSLSDAVAAEKPRMCRSTYRRVHAPSDNVLPVDTGRRRGQWAR